MEQALRSGWQEYLYAPVESLEPEAFASPHQLRMSSCVTVLQFQLYNPLFQPHPSLFFMAGTLIRIEPTHTFLMLTLISASAEQVS